MSKFSSTQELIVRISANLDKINSSEVKVQDFEDLLVETRELYERSLVLRFKAFEKHLAGESLNVHVTSNEFSESTINAKTFHVEGMKESEKQIPADSENFVLSNHESGFEFALFGEIHPQEESLTPDLDGVIDLPIQELPLPQNTKADNQEVAKNKDAEQIVNTPTLEAVREIPVDFNKPISGGSILDKLASNSQSNSLADQLKNTRISSIASSLTLNDRIRFAKNLFEGNSETFNSSVQLIDSQNSLNDALELMRQYSDRFNWNQEDKNIMDFYELVERRHA
jgi:hypothetical protein